MHVTHDSDTDVYGFRPPLPKLTGLANIAAAIHQEADFADTARNEGEAWTRQRHVEWLRVCWSVINGPKMKWEDA